MATLSSDRSKWITIAEGQKKVKSLSSPMGIHYIVIVITMINFIAVEIEL